jgi:hypothetical protein
LGTLVGYTDSFIKDSNEFIGVIKNEKVKPENILIIFDVFSIFTKILLDEAIQVVKEVTDEKTKKIVKVCLCSTFFSYQGEFYEQTSSVAMGSPLSPIVSNLFMENFENKSLESYPLKPLRWKICVYDKNVLWLHGKEDLEKFLQHINDISKDIKFTMGLE